MKKHINPVIALISCLALALASCGKSDADGSLPTNGQGMLQLSFDIPGYGGQSKAAEYDALAISTLRLYKVEPDGQGLSLIHIYRNRDYRDRRRDHTHSDSGNDYRRWSRFRAFGYLLSRFIRVGSIIFGRLPDDDTGQQADDHRKRNPEPVVDL